MTLIFREALSASLGWTAKTTKGKKLPPDAGEL